MLSKNNQNKLARQMLPQKQRWGLRKLSVGVASVLLGLVFMGYGESANADALANNSQTSNITQQSSSTANNNQPQQSSNTVVNNSNKDTAETSMATQGSTTTGNANDSQGNQWPSTQQNAYTDSDTNRQSTSLPTTSETSSKDSHWLTISMTPDTMNPNDNSTSLHFLIDQSHTYYTGINVDGNTKNWQLRIAIDPRLVPYISGIKMGTAGDPQLTASQVNLKAMNHDEGSNIWYLPYTTAYGGYIDLPDTNPYVHPQSFIYFNDTIHNILSKIGDTTDEPLRYAIYGFDTKTGNMVNTLGSMGYFNVSDDPFYTDPAKDYWQGTDPFIMGASLTPTFDNSVGSNGAIVTWYSPFNTDGWGNTRFNSTSSPWNKTKDAVSKLTYQINPSIASQIEDVSVYSYKDPSSILTTKTVNGTTYYVPRSLSDSSKVAQGSFDSSTGMGSIDTTNLDFGSNNKIQKLFAIVYKLKTPIKDLGINNDALKLSAYFVNSNNQLTMNSFAGAVTGTSDSDGDGIVDSFEQQDQTNPQVSIPDVSNVYTSENNIHGQLSITNGNTAVQTVSVTVNGQTYSTTVTPGSSASSATGTIATNYPFNINVSGATLNANDKITISVSDINTVVPQTTNVVVQAGPTAKSNLSLSEIPNNPEDLLNVPDDISAQNPTYTYCDANGNTITSPSWTADYGDSQNVYVKVQFNDAYDNSYKHQLVIPVSIRREYAINVEPWLQELTQADAQKVANGTLTDASGYNETSLIRTPTNYLKLSGGLPAGTTVTFAGDTQELLNDPNTYLKAGIYDIHLIINHNGSSDTVTSHLIVCERPMSTIIYAQTSTTTDELNQALAENGLNWIYNRDKDGNDPWKVDSVATTWKSIPDVSSVTQNGENVEGTFYVYYKYNGEKILTATDSVMVNVIGAKGIDQTIFQNDALPSVGSNLRSTDDDYQSDDTNSEWGQPIYTKVNYSVNGVTKNGQEVSLTDSSEPGIYNVTTHVDFEKTLVNEPQTVTDESGVTSPSINAEGERNYVVFDTTLLNDFDTSSKLAILKLPQGATIHVKKGANLSDTIDDPNSLITNIDKNDSLAPHSVDSVWKVKPSTLQNGTGTVTVHYTDPFTSKDISHDASVNVIVDDFNIEGVTKTVWQNSTLPTDINSWVSGAPAGSTFTFDTGTPKTDSVGSFNIPITVTYNGLHYYTAAMLYVRALPGASAQITTVGTALIPDNSWLKAYWPNDTTGLFPSGLANNNLHVVDGKGNDVTDSYYQTAGAYTGTITVDYDGHATYTLQVPIFVTNDSHYINDDATWIFKATPQEWHKTDSNVTDAGNSNAFPTTNILTSINKYVIVHDANGSHYQFDASGNPVIDTFTLSPDGQTYSDGTQSFSASNVKVTWISSYTPVTAWGQITDASNPNGTTGTTLYTDPAAKDSTGNSRNRVFFTFNGNAATALGLNPGQQSSDCNVYANYYGAVASHPIIVATNGHLVIGGKDETGKTSYLLLEDTIDQIGKVSSENFTQYINDSDLQTWLSYHPGATISYSWADPDQLSSIYATPTSENETRTVGVKITFSDTPNNPLTIQVPVKVINPTDADNGNPGGADYITTTFEYVEHPDWHKFSSADAPSNSTLSAGNFIKSFTHYKLIQRNGQPDQFIFDGTYTYNPSTNTYDGTDSDGNKHQYSANDIVLTWNANSSDETSVDAFNNIPFKATTGSNTATAEYNSYSNGAKLYVHGKEGTDFLNNIMAGSTLIFDEHEIAPNFYGATANETIVIDKAGNIKNDTGLTGNIANLTGDDLNTALKKLINTSDLDGKFVYTLSWVPADSNNPDTGSIAQIKDQLAKSSLKKGDQLTVPVRINFKDGTYLDVNAKLEITWTQADDYQDQFKNGKSIWIMQGDHQFDKFITKVITKSNSFNDGDLSYAMKLGQVNYWTNPDTHKLEKLKNVKYTWDGHYSTSDVDQPGWISTSSPANDNNDSIKVTFSDGSSASFKLDILVIARPILLPIDVPTGYVLNDRSGSLLVADYGKGDGYVNGFKWLQKPGTTVAGQATGRASLSYDYQAYKRDSNGKIIYDTDSNGKRVPEIDTTAHPAFGKYAQRKLDNYVVNINTIRVVDGDFAPTIVRGTTTTAIVKKAADGTVTSMKFIDNQNGHVRDTFTLDKQGKLTNKNGQQLFSTTTNTLRINQSATAPTSDQLKQVLNTQLLDSFGMNYKVSPENLQLDEKTGKATGNVKLSLAGLDFTMPLATSFVVMPDEDPGQASTGSDQPGTETTPTTPGSNASTSGTPATSGNAQSTTPGSDATSNEGSIAQPGSQEPTDLQTPANSGASSSGNSQVSAPLNSAAPVTSDGTQSQTPGSTQLGPSEVSSASEMLASSGKLSNGSAVQSSISEIQSTSETPAAFRGRTRGDQALTPLNDDNHYSNKALPQTGERNPFIIIAVGLMGLITVLGLTKNRHN